MRCDIGCWVAVFSLPECFVSRVWEGARHCCRLWERRSEQKIVEQEHFHLRNQFVATYMLGLGSISV